MATDTTGFGTALMHGLLQINPGTFFLTRHRMTVDTSRQACMVTNTACVVVCLVGLVIKGNRIHANGFRISAFRRLRSDKHNVGLPYPYARYHG